MGQGKKDTHSSQYQESKGKAFEDTTKHQLLLVDDHPVILAGIKNIIQSFTEIDRIYTANNGEKALEQLSLHAINICIIDIELPDMSGFDLIERIRLLYPHIRIIIETMHNEIWSIRRMIETDADAIVLKQSDPEELHQAVCAVLEGEKYYCRYVQQYQKEKQPGSDKDLSKRELEVLKYIAKGMKSNEIAETLYISVNTVEFHRKQIMVKLDARNVSDMISKGIEKGLLIIT